MGFKSLLDMLASRYWENMKVSDDRLIIPELGINVLLFWRESGSGQEIVDAPNSAVIFSFGRMKVIADHNYQANFSNLSRAKVGTIALIDLDKVRKKYKCVITEVGHIKMNPTSNSLFDASWNQVYANPRGDICIYTCLGMSAADVRDVRLTFWRCVD